MRVVYKVFESLAFASSLVAGWLVIAGKVEWVTGSVYMLIFLFVGLMMSEKGEEHGGEDGQHSGDDG
jgi:hypothetical protein